MGFGCPEQKYTCDNKKCIPKQYQCDAKDDCGDNSDEEKGCCDFICRNGKCVNHQSICDGKNDCGDFTDEDECKGRIQPFRHFKPRIY